MTKQINKMKRLVLFYIVLSGLSLLVSLTGCKTVEPCPGFSNSDSARIDTVIVTDSIFFVSPEWIKQLYYCNEKGELQLQEISNWKAKFDSASRKNPIVKRTKETHIIFIEHKKYLPGQVLVKYVEVPKVPAFVWFIVGFCAIVFICVGMIVMLVYNDRKSLKKELNKII